MNSIYHLNFKARPRALMIFTCESAAYEYLLNNVGKDNVKFYELAEMVNTDNQGKTIDKYVVKSTIDMGKYDYTKEKGSS